MKAMLLGLIAIALIGQLPSGMDLSKPAHVDLLDRYKGASKSLWNQAIVVVASIDDRTFDEGNQSLLLKPIALLAGSFDPTSVKDIRVYFERRVDKKLLEDARRHSFVIVLLNKEGERFVIPRQSANVDFFNTYAERGTIIWMTSLDSEIIEKVSSQLLSQRTKVSDLDKE